MIDRTASIGRGTCPFYPTSYQLHHLEHGLIGRIQKLGQRLISSGPRATTLQRLSELPPGDLLDVGCDERTLARSCSSGLASLPDPSAQACEIARTGSAGPRWHAGVDSLARRLDAVVMAFARARSEPTISNVLRALRPGGLLLVTVPNFCGNESVRPSMVPLTFLAIGHTSLKALRLGLGRAGFDVLRLIPGNDWFSLLMVSLQYRFAGRMVMTSGPAIWISYLIGVLVSPFVRLLDRMEGGGLVLHAVARRPAVSRVPCAPDGSNPPQSRAVSGSCARRCAREAGKRSSSRSSRPQDADVRETLSDSRRTDGECIPKPVSHRKTAADKPA